MFNKLIGDRAFYRKLFAVMTPVLIQNVITNFVSLLDNIMVGQVGTEPMSGVAIVNQLLFVFNLCIFGGLAGAGILTAQFYGKSDNKGVRDTFKIKLYFAFAASLLGVLILVNFGDTLVMQFLHEGENGLDLEYIQIDDGYQAHWGDWFEFTDKFENFYYFETYAQFQAKWKEINKK